MKKLMQILLCTLMVLGTSTPLIAEDYSDTNAWVTRCAKADLTAEEKTACAGFSQHMSDSSTDLRNQLAAIEKERDAIKVDIAKYGQEIAGYNSQIAVLEKEIAELNSQISVKAAEISAKEEEITVKEAEVEVLKAKMKERMVTSQSAMRLSQYIDVVMGAQDLTDLVRRTNGINDISNFDQGEREKLKILIDELNTAKIDLEADRAQLELDKADIVTKQNSILVMRRKAEIAKDESQKQEAELEAAGNRIAGNLEGIKQALAAISTSIDGIVSSSGFTRPVSGRVSAGTWQYPNGGTHLGMDFAPGRGVTIRAAGNGVVIKRVDGCSTDGYMGSACGEAQGGSRGGGNQVYLLTKINDTLYAVKYLHMEEGSPIAQNTIVSAGDYLGRVGSSGNSSGNHVHVEVFVLGSMSINDYISTWNGDLAFGCGWGGANKACGSAPCRVRPETVFG